MRVLLVRRGTTGVLPTSNIQSRFASQHRFPVELCPFRIRLLSVRNLEGRGRISDGRVRSDFIKRDGIALTGGAIRADTSPNGGANPRIQREEARKQWSMDWVSLLVGLNEVSHAEDVVDETNLSVDVEARRRRG